MDPSQLVQQAPTGLEGWITSNQALIQVVLWGAQLAFWVGMLIILFYAVWQYKRWVNFQLGTGRSGKLRDADAADAAVVSERKEATPDVDKFVD